MIDLFLSQDETALLQTFERDVSFFSLLWMPLSICHVNLSIPSVCILQKPWLPPHTAQTWCVLQAFILHENHFCCTIPLCQHSFNFDSNHRVEEIHGSVIKASSLPLVLLHSIKGSTLLSPITGKSKIELISHAFLQLVQTRLWIQQR